MFRRRGGDDQDENRGGLLGRRDGDGPGGGPTRYTMREKLVDIGDDFWIESGPGRRAFKVDGKAVRLRNTLDLEEPNGRVVAQIQERMLRVKDAMAIERDGQKIAEVKKDLINIVRDEFKVDLQGRGNDLEVRGNILAHEYEITQDGRKVAEVSKKWVRVRETYTVDVEPGQDDALLLAVAICVDQMTGSQERDT
jgi:uncharacterized protein YxjI